MTTISFIFTLFIKRFVLKMSIYLRGVWHFMDDMKTPMFVISNEIGLQIPVALQTRTEIEPTNEMPSYGQQINKP